MKVSIAIPVKNEAASIAALLDALLTQSCQPAEILITDGGSSDQTVPIIEEYQKQNPHIQLFRQTQALPGRGRNIAAANASSDWLAFIDGGVVPTHDWLAQLIAVSEADPELDVVFGSWEPITDSFFTECAALAYAYVPDSRNLEQVKKGRAIFSSLMRRDVWKDSGGFREDLRSAEDHLFINEIEQRGYRIGYAPNAIVRWVMQATIRDTFKRFIVYSRNNLLAGLAEDWQSPLLIRYVTLLLVCLQLITLTRWWPLLVPLLLVGFLAVRSLLTLWRNRKRFPAAAIRTVMRFLALMPFLGMLDVATMLGSIRWLVLDKGQTITSGRRPRPATIGSSAD